jgi:hypothetical protein
MKLFVQIMDDDGTVKAEHTADLSQPSRWTPPSGQRFVSKMPQNSDNENSGTYEVFGVTFQPHLRVDRPNGWKEPNPSLAPIPQLPQGFPTNLGAPKASFPYNKNAAPWSASAPTQQAMNLMGSAPQRG